MLGSARRVALLVTAMVATTLVPGAMGDTVRAGTQDDGGSGGDAGNTFDTATPITPEGAHHGSLDNGNGDTDDFYRFPLAEGSSTSVLITFDGWSSERVTLLDPNGLPVDSGASLLGAGVSASAAITTELAGLRLAVHRAAIAGDYRLHITAQHLDVGSYEICFMICEGPVDAPIEFVFGGSLATAETDVLLIPPSHGDLGNPTGPTVLDYIDATVRGMHRWVDALHAFADDFPEYAYLKDITVDIELFDGITPIDLDGYDVIVSYVAAGPVFRGVASNPGPLLGHLLDAGSDVRFPGRVIALSLFGGSPRAGQVLYDFPEVSDLENVTMHEFGHTFGLGHTETWHPELGPDLMNSPATFVYGDGFPAGDGGERTPTQCFSSLDLYGMAHLYRWLPSGEREATHGEIRLPKKIPYQLYC